MATTLIPIEVASARMGRAVRTLYRWRYSGDMGPPSARVGGRVMYREADVEAWISEQFEKDAAERTPAAS